MQKNRKKRTGIVVSNSCDKSVSVLIERKVRHPLYKKILKRSKKFMAHDAYNKCNIGDKVKIIETRPLSKKKCWRVVEILNKAK